MEIDLAPLGSGGAHQREPFLSRQIGMYICEGVSPVPNSHIGAPRRQLHDVGVFDRLIKDLSKKLFGLRERRTAAFENGGWSKKCTC
jgi:hypothetical protein